MVEKNQQSGRKHQQCRIDIQHKKQDGQDFQELKAQLIKNPTLRRITNRVDQADRKLSGIEGKVKKILCLNINFRKKNQTREMTKAFAT